jgi:hypothetical protein
MPAANSPPSPARSTASSPCPSWCSSSTSRGKRLSIAVINRRQNKRDDKDVLGKVTIIRDISLANPTAATSTSSTPLRFDRARPPAKKPITDFDTLHAAWEQVFNVELLNKRFYRELANWYFWALPQVEFPADLEPDDEKRRATGLIRLLTRLIFCWFLKEKGLIPEKTLPPRRPRQDAQRLRSRERNQLHLLPGHPAKPLLRHAQPAHGQGRQGQSLPRVRHSMRDSRKTKPPTTSTTISATRNSSR